MPLFRRRKPALSADHRRALKLLASSPDGITEALMLTHGFTAAMLRDLVLAGLVTAEGERMRAGGRAIEVTRLKMTQTGTQALRMGFDVLAFESGLYDMRKVWEWIRNGEQAHKSLDFLGLSEF